MVSPKPACVHKGQKDVTKTTDIGGRRPQAEVFWSIAAAGTGKEGFSHGSLLKVCPLYV